jgi:excisionase family DNA binding protein
MALFRLLSVREVATLLGLSIHTVRGYVRGGVLKYVKIGRRVLIEPSVVEAFIGERRVYERD